MDSVIKFRQHWSLWTLTHSLCVFLLNAQVNEHGEKCVMDFLLFALVPVTVRIICLLRSTTHYIIKIYAIYYSKPCLAAVPLKQWQTLDNSKKDFNLPWWVWNFLRHPSFHIYISYKCLEFWLQFSSDVANNCEERATLEFRFVGFPA